MVLQVFIGRDGAVQDAKFLHRAVRPMNTCRTTLPFCPAAALLHLGRPDQRAEPRVPHRRLGRFTGSKSMTSRLPRCHRLSR